MNPKRTCSSAKCVANGKGMGNLKEGDAFLLFRISRTIFLKKKISLNILLRSVHSVWRPFNCSLIWKSRGGVRIKTQESKLV